MTVDGWMAEHGNIPADEEYCKSMAVAICQKIYIVFVQQDKFLLVNSIAILCQVIYCFCPTRRNSADEEHGNSGCNIVSGDKLMEIWLNSTACQRK